MTAGSTPPPFPRAALAGPCLDAARALLGALLIRRVPGTPDRVGRIVEVEAYAGEDDAASHARFGRTGRSRVMYGEPGTAYVYLVYGMHHCLNVVTEPEERPAAVLIRALEPVAGLDAMRTARGTATASRVVRNARLAAGPGLVAAAFGIDRSHTGLDLCDAASPLRLAPAPAGAPVPDIRATARIGVGYAHEPWRSAPWRLLVAGSPSLSGPASLRTGTPA